MNRVLITMMVVCVVSTSAMYHRGNCSYNENVIDDNGAKRAPSSDEWQQIQEYTMSIQYWAASQGAYWRNITGNLYRGENNQVQDNIKPQPPCLCTPENCF